MDYNVIWPEFDEWEVYRILRANREHDQAVYREFRVKDLYHARMFLNGAIKQTERLEEDTRHLVLARKLILHFQRLRKVEKYHLDRSYD